MRDEGVKIKMLTSAGNRMPCGPDKTGFRTGFLCGSIKRPLALPPPLDHDILMSGNGRWQVVRESRRGGRYEFKAIVTNKRTYPLDIFAFDEGQGAQEGILAEPGTHCRTDCVPAGNRAGNQPYMFAGIPARNPTRGPRIRPAPRARGTTARRTAPWCFRGMGTFVAPPFGAPDASFDRPANRSSP